MIVMSEIVPLENRGKYNGVINAVFALSSVFGPLVGVSTTIYYVMWHCNIMDLVLTTFKFQFIGCHC